MKHVILITGHYLESKRKAGFHWLADAFWRADWDVTFVTDSLSWISWLKRDYRFEYPVIRESKKIRNIRDRLASYVWLTPYHPANLRLPILNHLSKPLFSRYGKLATPGLDKRIAEADLFVFDSTHGLMLFDRFKAMNPRARFVYRISDDIPLMKNHPVLQETEERIAPLFDLVSASSAYILKRFAHLPQAVLHMHGVRKDLFDRPCTNPYEGPGPHVVFAGHTFFDPDFVVRAARLFPAWWFHIIGPVSVPPALNVVLYGEKPFVDIVPYLKHADIGLQAMKYLPGAESFSDTPKLHQYTYCKLPIVAPKFLQGTRPHVFYYEPGDDDSIRQALEAALRFDRKLIVTTDVWSWDDIIVNLAAPVAA